MQFKDEKKKLLNETKFKDKKGKTRTEFDKYCYARFQMFKEGLTADEVDLAMIEHYGDLNAKMFKQMHNAKMKQKQNTNDHLSYLLRKGYNCYFITLTFRDDVLNNTTADNRKKRIQRALKDFDDYLSNVDFGDETEREHFHALAALTWAPDELVVNARDYYHSIGEHEIACSIKNKRAVVIKTPGLLSYMKNSGFVYAEKVTNNSKSKNKLSEYVAKLTAHSIKVKQTYISVKKGTDYQKYKDAWKLLKERNTADTLDSDRYVYLQHTLYSHSDVQLAFVNAGEMKIYEVKEQISSKREKQRMKWLEQRLAEVRDIELPEDPSERVTIEGLSMKPREKAQSGYTPEDLEKMRNSPWLKWRTDFFKNNKY